MSTADAQLQSMIENLPAKTGKSLPDWLALLKDSGLEKHGAVVRQLKAEHGMTHGFANLVAHEFLRSAATHADGDDLVAAQYAGRKAGLKPIFEALSAAVTEFGSDVELAPKNAYVSLRRNKQFGLVQPSTATRVDVGLNLKGVEPGGRLEASGSFNSMCSHRVRIESTEQVDEELIGWLRRAYDAS